MDPAVKLEHNAYFDDQGQAVGLEVVSLQEGKRSSIRTSAVSGAVTETKEPIEVHLAEQILDKDSVVTLEAVVLDKGQVRMSDAYLLQVQAQAAAEAQAQELSPQGLAEDQGPVESSSPSGSA